ncbi:MAG: hypothetical protein ACYDDF_10755 [Thermoplasmatota archaeon]
MRATILLIPMYDQRYILRAGSGRAASDTAPSFPEGPLAAGEMLGVAARRLLGEAGLAAASPKLDLVDIVPNGPDLRIVIRAFLTEPPAATAPFVTFGRMELPAAMEPVSAQYVEETLRTGINYKLTRT